MARNTKGATKKVVEKEVKEEVKDTIVEEKKEEANVAENNGETDIVPSEDKKEEIVEDVPDTTVNMEIDNGEDMPDGSEKTDIGDSEFEGNEPKPIEEEEPRNETPTTPRWARDVYGYNWMGQCFDE